MADEHGKGVSRKRPRCHSGLAAGALLAAGSATSVWQVDAFGPISGLTPRSGVGLHCQAMGLQLLQAPPLCQHTCVLQRDTTTGYRSQRCRLPMSDTGEDPGSTTWNVTALEQQVHSSAAAATASATQLNTTTPESQAAVDGKGKLLGVVVNKSKPPRAVTVPDVETVKGAMVGVVDASGKLVRQQGQKRWNYAMAKIRREPWQTLTIPLSAAFVGWITNKLAVEMIFYPLCWRGIPIHVIEGQPLGLLGWQGIVPAKAGVMAERMVDMVTTQLVDVDEVFRRLDPRQIAALLGPEIGRITDSIGCDLLPRRLAWLPGGLGGGLPFAAREQLRSLRDKMLVDLTKDMQGNIGKVLDLKELVVGEMLADRRKLVELFQRCGRAEFKFLVNSGLWFGFLLGVGQMVLWLLCDRPWTLPVGGAVVGYLTNWLALKLIFEPVEPIRLGGWSIQGLFLKRQHAVSAEFADFFASKVLTSQLMWNTMLFGKKSLAFHQLLGKHVGKFLRQASATVGVPIDDTLVGGLTAKVVAKLPEHIHVLHPYTDSTLRLRETMNLEMQKMTSRSFEGVLHPIFQEDEFTLVVAGGVLGAIAGFIQMLVSTKHEPPPASTPPGDPNSPPPVVPSPPGQTQATAAAALDPAPHLDRLRWLPRGVRWRDLLSVGRCLERPLGRHLAESPAWLSGLVTGLLRGVVSLGLRKVCRFLLRGLSGRV